MLTDLTSAILGKYIWHGTVVTSLKRVRDGKELSTDLKETIMGLDQEGYSACKIAEFLSLNRRTVSCIIKRYRGRGTVENLPRSTLVDTSNRNRLRNSSAFESGIV
jgi:IS30 family transposase